MLQSEPITIRTNKKTVAKLDDIAANLDRSRNYIVNKAIEHYIEAQAWQTGRITAGLKAARKGQVIDIDTVFERVYKKQGWKK